MTFELLNQLATLIFYAAIFLYPVAALFLGRHIRTGMISAIAGISGTILFIVLIGSAYYVPGRWVEDRLNCHETSAVNCAALSPDERHKLLRALNDKGRDFGVVFGFLLSIPYGIAVSLFIVISRLIHNKLAQPVQQNRAAEQNSRTTRCK